MGRSAKGLLKRVRNRETSLSEISGGCWLQRRWCLLMNREVYHNMPHKSLQALRWTQMNCRYAPVLSNHNFVTSNLWLVHCGYVQVLNFVTGDLQKGTLVGEDGWWHGAFNNSTGQAGQQAGEGGGRQGGGEIWSSPYLSLIFRWGRRFSAATKLILSWDRGIQNHIGWWSNPETNIKNINFISQVETDLEWLGMLQK